MRGTEECLAGRMFSLAKTNQLSVRQWLVKDKPQVNQKGVSKWQHGYSFSRS
jgi:hypothetical protein